MKSQLIRLYRESLYFRINILERIKISLCDSDTNRILLQNKEFRNCHEGKRCFILGNGPSIKTEDLSLLSSEIVFTVNQAARMENFDKLKTNYHFWADELFFKQVDSQGSKELLDVMKRVNGKENKPFVFFPIEQRKFVEQHELNKVLKVRYFKTGVQMYENFNHLMDYTKIGPSFCTVVQWCISMAIYMGFKEIYLLGCDNTSLLVTLKSALKQNDDNDYGYHITSNEKNRMEKLLNYSSLETYTKSYLKNMQQYRYLVEYCRKRNISLVNCSSSTVLDCMPRKTLQSVLNN